MVELEVAAVPFLVLKKNLIVQKKTNVKLIGIKCLALETMTMTKKVVLPKAQARAMLPSQLLLWKKQQQPL